MTVLGQADLRWSTTRDRDGGPPLLHPGFLGAGRGKGAAGAVEPIVASLIAYVGGLVGQPRRAFSNDAAAEIAGDRRLGRGLLAACLDGYRWTARTFEEALPADMAAALRVAGIDGAPALRLRLFDLVNREYAGYVPAARRPEALATLAHELGLPADAAPALDTALMLDAEAEALLTPAEAPPTVAAVLARYNRALLTAFLRLSERVTFALQAPSGGLLRKLYAVCRKLGVYCDVEAGGGPGLFRLTLAGPDAIVAAPAAAGPRLALAALRIIATMGDGDRGSAELRLHDRRYRLTLAQALLAVPGLVADAAHDDEADEATMSADSAVEATFIGGFAALRRQGRANGWRLVREPSPLLAGARVLIPDFAITRGDLRVLIEVAGFWTPGYVARKRRALEQVDPATRLVLAVPEANVAAFVGLPFPLVAYRDTIRVHEVLAAAEAHYSDFTARTADAAARLTTLCADSAADGWVAEGAVAAALGCVSGGELQQVLADLTLPAGWAYLPGMGLCGAALEGRLAAALAAVWAEAPARALTLAETRLSLPDVVLPTEDAALAAVLARLPAVALDRGSLFDLTVRWAAAPAIAVAPPASTPTEMPAVPRTRRPATPRKRPAYQAEAAPRLL